HGWELADTFAISDVPDSIEGVITARLDRLGSGTRVLVQLAAVVGRRFPTSLITPLRNGLGAPLGSLERSGVLVAEGGEYVFRHVLVRDVAYESILLARRRELHHRVAVEIETQEDSSVFSDSWDGRLALLGRHYLLAEDWAPAFRYHLLAGRSAQSHYANSE